MSNIFIPGNIDHLPLTDIDLFYVNAPYLLSPSNYAAISDSLDNETLNRIRFGHYVGLSCCYPRFDLMNYFYKLRANPILNILPDRNPKHVDFDTITNQRANQLCRTAEKYEKVYLFWSGGIDSTTVLCAILKNWDSVSLSKLVIVLNHHSISEHPNMYRNMIQHKINEVSTDSFFSGEILLSNDSLYITGDLADPLFGYDSIYEFDEKYPGLYKKSWKKNIDTLVDHFSVAGTNSGKFVVDQVAESLDRSAVELETVFDFLWWLNFNWGHDVDLYFLLWQFSTLPSGVNAATFMEENICLFFNNVYYQNWGMTTIGTDLKIGDEPASYKISAKRYIYEFDRDIEYFINKRKEVSTSKNNHWFTNKRLFAIDTNYNLYYSEPSIWHRPDHA
jgi:hypothetical protein